ncbi:MAG: peptide ligase PGM1-related protein, partial [Spirulinaceae cyanobacterium]
THSNSQVEMTTLQISLGARPLLCSSPKQTYTAQMLAIRALFSPGQALAAKGALERYGVDFVAVHHPDTEPTWQLYAIEINLRKGGTTHPFMALQFLTNGNYDPNTGKFLAQDQAKYYMASDNLYQPRYQGLLPHDLMDIITRHRLHFDTSTKTGTVFHLIGALSEFGKLGLISIDNSFAAAEAHYRQVEAVLAAETEPDAGQAQANAVPMSWA